MIRVGESGSSERCLWYDDAQQPTFGSIPKQNGRLNDIKCTVTSS